MILLAMQVLHCHLHLFHNSATRKSMSSTFSVMLEPDFSSLVLKVLHLHKNNVDILSITSHTEHKSSSGGTVTV